MKEPMRILIAYDGSKCAEAALANLQRAGLPSQAQTLVISVAEQGLPSPRSIGMVETHFAEEFPHLLEEAQVIGRHACARLHDLFPRWETQAEAVFGSPARVVLEKADEWQPDLVVVGSHGRSALGRFLLGSVSQKVVTEAGGSVRIARGGAGEHGAEVRLIVGVDGSEGAAAAVRAVAARRWPPDCAALVVTAEVMLPPLAADHAIGPIMAWLREEREQRRVAAKAALDTLRAAGLSVRTVTKEGLAKDVLVEEAERWGADCIFVGAQQLTRVDRFLLGSVSAAVAARAHCSVEVVRPAHNHQ